MNKDNGENAMTCEQQTVDLIRKLDFVIGMRLHSVIITTENNIPVIGISYDDKVSHYLDCKQERENLLLDFKNYW